MVELIVELHLSEREQVSLDPAELPSLLHQVLLAKRTSFEHRATYAVFYGRPFPTTSRYNPHIT